MPWFQVIALRYRGGARAAAVWPGHHGGRIAPVGYRGTQQLRRGVGGSVGAAAVGAAGLGGLRPTLRIIIPTLLLLGRREARLLGGANIGDGSRAL